MSTFTKYPNKHFSEPQLHEYLGSHNPDLTRGFLCQCLNCLYALSYWESQYGVKYHEKPSWALKTKVS